MPESFDEIVRSAKQKIVSAQTAQSASQKQALERSIETSLLRQAVSQEAPKVAAALAGRVSTMGYAISSDTALKANVASRVSNRSMNPNPPRPSEHKLRKAQEKAQNIRNADCFPVWDLETDWTRREGEGDYEDIITEHNFLDTDGQTHHGHFDSDSGYVVLSTIGETAYEHERLTSVRQGLAHIVAKNNLAIELIVTVLQ